MDNLDVAVEYCVLTNLLEIANISGTLLFLRKKRGKSGAELVRARSEIRSPCRAIVVPTIFLRYTAPLVSSYLEF